MVFSDQVAASETPFGSYGEMIVTDAALAIGVTAIPNPSGIDGDPDAAWYVWQAVSTRFQRSSDVGTNSDAGFHYQIDSKSMRKVGINDDAVSMYDNQISNGMTLITNGRQLIQLH